MSKRSGRLVKVLARTGSWSSAVAVAAVVVLCGAVPAAAAQAPVGLGTAGSFAILAGAGITNTGPTTITGDVGSFPTTTETGFGSVTLNGTNHAGDAVTQGAKDALVVAYNDAASRGPATTRATELGGATLLAGVYTSASTTFGLTGTLTLDAAGDPSAMFIFQMGSTLITETNSRVALVNGADPCHVVWQVGSSATFNTGTSFVGDVLVMDSITAQTSSTFRGRLLARNGAVTVDTNTITNGTCASADGGGGATTATTTVGTTITTAAAGSTAPVTTIIVPAQSTTSTTARTTTATTSRATSTNVARPPLATTGAQHVIGPLRASVALLAIGVMAVRFGRPRRGAHWR